MNLPLANPANPAPAPQGLANLEARLRQDLSWLEIPAKNLSLIHI